MTSDAPTGPKAEEVLADLPQPLWGALSRAVRRAVERLAVSDLPPALRPIAKFKPERMAEGRARSVVIGAIAADAELRAAVGEALDSPAAYTAAADVDPLRLADQHGEEMAVAALVAQARWEGVAVLAAAAAQRLAVRDLAASESAARDRAARVEASRQRLSEEVAAARAERDAARGRAEAADQAQRRERAARVQAEQRVQDLEHELDELRTERARERARAERRLDRLRGQLADAQAATRVDQRRVRQVLDELDRLGAELRAALEGMVVEGEPAPIPHLGGETSAVLPRAVPPADAGRPSALPAGVDPDSPAAVSSLLQVTDMRLLVDGYNVSLGAGRAAPLHGQRLWLEQVAAGLVARYRCRATLVFDGREGFSQPHASPRGITVVFTAEEETADDWIVGLLQATPDLPSLVVTSDRELVDRCRREGANVIGSAAFLQAAG